MDALQRLQEMADPAQLSSHLVNTMSGLQRNLRGRTSMIALAIAIAIWEYPRWSKPISRLLCGPDPHDPDTTDSDFLRQNSQITEVKTKRYTYPGIRVFFKRHPEQKELPGSLPLLVFIHGLGGSVAQFEALLKHFTCRASCLAIDLPGCGRSQYAVTDWDAYTTDALVEFLEGVISQYVEEDQSIVLIGHSYGCGLAARVAVPQEGLFRGRDTHGLDVVGLIALCPPLKEISENEARNIRRVLWVPERIFDMWREYDRWGGINSQSVLRFVGKDADEVYRRLQLRFNAQSRSPVVRRFLGGTMPSFNDGQRVGGLPGTDVWASLRIPVLLVSGASDHVTKPAEADKIYDARLAMQKTLTDNWDASFHLDSPTEHSSMGDANSTGSASATSTSSPPRAASPKEQLAAESTPSTPTTQSSPPIEIPDPPKPTMLTERLDLPAPASHALFYDPAHVNPVAVACAEFLSTHVTGRFDLGWQLRFLSRGGKWDVKNLAKWRDVAPVSQTIAGIFRAMKTLREADDVHSPAKLVENWRYTIEDVVDISHDRPVYAPQGLENGGIRYHKFPSVSKIPPAIEEVKGFVALIDRIRKERTDEIAKADNGAPTQTPLIGVHCHYGFNRTGFFIVSYLVEREGFTLEEAVAEFAKKRPNGIRHQHFLETLSLRYANGAGVARRVNCRGGGTGESAEWGE